MIPKLTIDTSAINVHRRLDAVNALERWQDEGKILLVGAERLKDETANYPPAKAKVASMLNVSEPVVWGFLDGDMGTGRMERTDLSIAKLLQYFFPVKILLKCRTAIKPT